MEGFPLPLLHHRSPIPPPNLWKGVAKYSLFPTPCTFKKSGLVTNRHQLLCNRVADLARKSFMPSHVRYNSLTYIGTAMQVVKTQLDMSPSNNNPPQHQYESGKKGNLLIWYLWHKGMDSVLYTIFVNIDAIFYQYWFPDKCLQIYEKEKKRNYQETCLHKLCHFSPFVIYVDGFLGVEAEETLKHLTICLTAKWQQPYSCMCGYIISRFAITMVRARHCVSGARG